MIDFLNSFQEAKKKIQARNCTSHNLRHCEKFEISVFEKSSRDQNSKKQ
jgi:hypothetical protein